MSAKILLVEDNPRYMEINKEALTKNGYTVFEAASLTKGREMFLKETPDLIVLDIALPDGDDYLTKPYGLNVLLKRVEKILAKSKTVPDTLVKGRLSINILSGTVTFDGRELGVKKGKEFNVLLFLAKMENTVLTNV
jgi:DNA-binding response OmpR family regulator